MHKISSFCKIMAKKDKSISALFGETIVSLGFVNPADLHLALQEQKAREARGDKPILIGMLMVEMGLITLNQLIKAISSHTKDFNLSISEDAIRIATRVKALFSERDKVISFSSAVEREGVSSLISQFAIALTLMGEGPVLLIDANPHRASLHSFFRCPRTPGLLEILEKNQGTSYSIQQTSLPSLSLLPAGNNSGDSYSLFLSESFPLLLKSLREQYRFVLVDTPPFLKYPDATVVASCSDGVVLLVSAGYRSKSEIIEVKRNLDGLRVNVLGYVLSERSS
jgi:capsular exopolysaccharide synthesis family protein